VNPKEERKWILVMLGICAIFIALSCSSCGDFRGPVGAQGEQGITGEPGPTGQTGAQGLQGATGATGANGQTGPAGSVGPAGPSGTPGTSITVVQLCPSYGPTQYPDNFPEQALCISGNLYGVYWSGTQAFLAEIVPGTYASTSPDGCTLTVNANCEVTEQKE
jgi:Collagen triple helix repeat (20 copies)